MIGNITFQRLVSIAGSAKDAWVLSKEEIKKLPHIQNKIAEEIGNPVYLKNAEKEIEYCLRNNIKILSYSEDTLPGLLKHCDDAPAILYQKGNFQNPKTNISIVGTRSVTSYGKKFIVDFLSALKNKNIQTISGLALGADSKVHEESLKNNIPTVAVVAHGLNRIYPSKNKSLAEKILENGGALLTEYGTKQAFIKENFIQRNRIIAGISPTTIVVETAYGGGSMSTAHFANLYNREVLALPGNIDHKYSQGCNLLISQNKARTIVNVENTLDYLQIGGKTSSTQNLFSETKDFSQLTTQQLEILQPILDFPDITLDDISNRLNLPPYQILPILLDLELKGFIQSTSGRKYRAM